MNNIKKLEAAANMLQEIKQLDAEIIQLEKYAQKAANDEVDLELQFDIVDLKQKLSTAGDLLNEDGSIKTHREVIVNLERGFRHYFDMNFGVPPSMRNEPQKEKTTYRQRVSNGAGLRILGILMFEKKDRREYLISQLHKMSFKI